MVLVLPAVLFLVGLWLGYQCASHYTRRRAGTAPVKALACVVLALSAIAASSSQVWWDMGLSYEVIRFAESAAVLVFGVVLGGTWNLVSPSNRRWWLLAAVPVGLAQSLQVAFMVTVWAINGFAP